MNLRRLSIFLAAILLVAAWSNSQNKTAQSAAPKGCDQLCLIQEASPACRKAIQALAKYDYRWIDGRLSIKFDRILVTQDAVSGLRWSSISRKPS